MIAQAICFQAVAKLTSTADMRRIADRQLLADSGPAAFGVRKAKADARRDRVDPIQTFLLDRANVRDGCGKLRITLQRRSAHGGNTFVTYEGSTTFGLRCRRDNLGTGRCSS